MLDGVLQGEHTALGLGLVTDVRLLLVHADHDTGVLGATHDGRENSAGGVVTGETGLHHTGTVIYLQRKIDCGAKYVG